MEIRKVEAAHGWLWFQQGWALFRQSAVLWVVLTALATVALALLIKVRLIGDPLATLLSPVLIGGLWMGCRDLEKGEELELAHLFAGFRHNTAQLVTLGGINLVSQLLIYGVMKVTGGAALVELMQTPQQDIDLQAMTAALSQASVALPLGALLSCVLCMLLWFAPLLVIFGGISPVDALKTSWQTCLRNMGALLVYGLALMPLALVASILMGLGWLILLPVIVTSLYASYRDIFPQSVAPAAPSLPQPSP